MCVVVVGVYLVSGSEDKESNLLWVSREAVVSKKMWKNWHSAFHAFPYDILPDDFI